MRGASEAQSEEGSPQEGHLLPLQDITDRLDQMARRISERSQLIDRTLSEGLELEEGGAGAMQAAYDRGNGGKLRNRDTLQKPKQFMAPILVKGQQYQCIPWPMQDLETLVNKLPNFYQGVGKWVRTLEEQMTGKILTAGDVKALLVRVVGVTKTESVLKNGGMSWLIGNSTGDARSFDPYRQQLWKALREEFPAVVNTDLLKGAILGETDNPAEYVQKQVEKWRMETERDPEVDTLVSHMFRKALVDALPTPVKAKLEDIAGLTTSKSHKEFRDCFVHAVDRHRQGEKRLAEQGKDALQKLTQMQLEELTKNKKSQAPVAAELTPDNTMAPVFQDSQRPPRQPRVVSQTPEAPFVRVYTQNPRQNQGGGHNQSRKQRPRGVCWGCNQAGHNRSDCPTNPWSVNLQYGRNNQNWQGTNQTQGGWQQVGQPPQNNNWQGSHQPQGGWHQSHFQTPQGPVNPYAGPNQ
ncbi:hypothetical protein UPYG_G00024970 [Umbra pygmaea]|uniref:CCHC-type domain-containing protein n=1 Tax=Umbra pygmaea TaxID=75934 RepID=A0ABD0XP55_UMBPY